MRSQLVAHTAITVWSSMSIAVSAYVFYIPQLLNKF
jgi:hypothetical protein